MPVPQIPSSSIVLTAEEVGQFEALRIPDGADLVIRDRDGNEIDLPERVRAILLATLESIIENGEVTIAQMPAELTSTAAAEVLGVSRPTLMKWARENKIDSFKVGTHTRFYRDDVLALKRNRGKDRNDAFDKLRSFELEEFGPIAD